MAVRTARFISLASSALLVAAAAVAWMSFMGFDIAYGDLVGLPGRESDLETFGRKAESALIVASICEALAIGIAFWTLLPLKSKWARTSVAIALALLADLFTFALIKGI